MTDKQLLEAFCEVGASFFQRGYATGSSGNMSVKLSDGTIVLTPTGSSLGKLSPDQLSVVTVEGQLVSGPKPTKEAPLHLSFYAQQPECRAVIHLHSPYATALSCLADLDANDALKPCTPYFTMKGGKLPVVPYFKPGSENLFVAAKELAGTTKALLLSNHGLVATGKTLNAAVNLAEELEASAQLHFILRGSNVRYLTQAEIAELMPH